jgi:type I site-specific restriction endonuclease
MDCVLGAPSLNREPIGSGAGMQQAPDYSAMLNDGQDKYPLPFVFSRNGDGLKSPVVAVEREFESGVDAEEAQVGCLV